MRKAFFLFLFIFLISLFSISVFGEIQVEKPHDENAVCIVYFYSESCPHCQNTKPFLNEMELKYENKISITRYDVSLPENVALYNQFCTAKNYSGKKIPLIGINDKFFVGEDEIKNNLEQEIIKGINSETKICPIEGMGSCHEINESAANSDADPLIPQVGKSLNFKAILPVILFTGLADGINPCAFAVLLFIMAFLQQISGNKKKLLKITISYIVAFLIMNILVGVLYFYTSMQLGYPVIIRTIAIILAIIAGLINIKDFFFYGKGFSLEIPKKAGKHIERLAMKATIPAAIVLGSLVAILEAPCSIPIYLTVIEVLKSQGQMLLQVLPYILLYNLMFILPIVILAVVIYIGAEAKALEKWREKNRRYMKLALGIVLILLAILMVFNYI
jgi:cytochrome c biogenesis protein CcdA/glutaredoxin